jgi:hypothetical protein
LKKRIVRGLIRAIVKKEKRRVKRKRRKKQQLYLVRQMTKLRVHSHPGEIEGLKRLRATDDDQPGTKEREIEFGRDSAAGLEDE